MSPFETTPYATGANESPFDIRTFSYKPDKANIKGGARYQPEDIEDQRRVGICTAISLTQNARKALGVKFSADFQYLMQKKFHDKNWGEGSSLSSALWVARNIGLLPESDFSFNYEKWRNRPYHEYIERLQSFSDEDIERLKLKAAKYKIKAFAKVPTDRDSMANAIDESDAGLLTRYSIGKKWWTRPIEPIQPTVPHTSGHAVTDSNYDGNSFRIANSWGTDWADKGTGYRLHNQYAPTEAWLVYYSKTPQHVDNQLENRKKIQGQILDLLQQVINLIKKT